MYNMASYVSKFHNHLSTSQSSFFFFCANSFLPKTKPYATFYTKVWIFIGWIRHIIQKENFSACSGIVVQHLCLLREPSNAHNESHAWESDDDDPMAPHCLLHSWRIIFLNIHIKAICFFFYKFISAKSKTICLQLTNMLLENSLLQLFVKGGGAETNQIAGNVDF